MKRLISLALAVMVLFTLTPPVAQAASTYSNIRVRLSVGTVTGLSVALSGSYYLQETGAVLPSSITVYGSGGTVRVQSGSQMLYSGSSVNIIRSNPTPSAGYVRLNTSAHGTRSYLGNMRFMCNSTGTLQVINTLPLEYYLYGVVAYEMSDTWPIEALKTQAVAARGYAVNALKSSGDYDIGDTSSDQVYKGYNSSYTNVINAVNGTRGQVLMYGGVIATTYYAASNGGQTDLPSNVWGRSLPYYAVMDDPADLRNKESRIIRAFLPPVGSSKKMNSTFDLYLRKKAVSSLAQYGVVSSDQISILGVQDFVLHTPRYGGNSRVYTKARITMQVGIGSTVPQVILETVQAKDAAGNPLWDMFGQPIMIQQQTTIQVPTGQQQQTVCTFDFSLSDIGPTSNYAVFKDSSMRMYLVEQVQGGGFNLCNVRYGHGVGMSQRGAQQRALEGQSYSQILAFYYPGTSLQTIPVTDAPTGGTVPDNTGGGTPAGGIGTGVTTSNLNLRSGPGTNHGIITTLAKGTSFNVISKSGDWYLISTGSRQGYVAGTGVKVSLTSTGNTSNTNTNTNTSTNTSVDDASGGMLVGTITALVNFRKGPSTAYAAIAKLATNTQVSIVGRDTNGWYKVHHSGEIGYVSPDYVKITGSTAAPSGPTAGVTLDPSKNYAQITASSAKLYSKASTSGSVLKSVPKNYVVELISRTSDSKFYKTTYDGSTGYLRREDFKLLAKGAMHPNPSQLTASSSSSSSSSSSTTTTAKKMVEVTYTFVNVRSSASSSSSKNLLGKANKGEKFEYVSTSGKFYKIKYKNGTAYVSTAYTKLK